MTMTATVKRRPKHLDLVKIRLPMPAFVSILHRLSGVLLFLFVPFILYLLERSLASDQSYGNLVSVVAHPLAKLLLLGLLWAFLHHLFAGIRYLLLDLHIGTDLAAARAGSGVVLVVSLLLTLLLGVKLW